MMARSTTAKNGHERIVTDRDNVKHLEYFMNGQWRHSDNCKDFTNKECTFKTVKSSLHQAYVEITTNRIVIHSKLSMTWTNIIFNPISDHYLSFCNQGLDLVDMDTKQ